MTVQHSLHRGSHGSSSVDVHTEKEHHRESQKEQKENRDQGSGRPRAGSESSRNPVSKVMDLIRHRSHSALSAEDKRKAVSGSLLFITDMPSSNNCIYSLNPTNISTRERLR